MMKHIKPIFTVTLLFLCSICLQAGEVADTLMMTDGTQVILSYRTIMNGSDCTIYFLGMRFRPVGGRKEYQEKSKVKAVFFDRVGTYDTSFSSIPSALCTIGNTSVDRSSSGYFFISDFETPCLTVHLNAEEQGGLNIPLYLAYYKKKGQWDILTQSRTNWVIHLSRPSASNNKREERKVKDSNGKKQGQPVYRNDTITTEEYVNEGGFAPGGFPPNMVPQYPDSSGDSAKSPMDYQMLIDNLMNEISEAKDEADLENIKGQLRQIQSSCSDPMVQQKVNVAVSACGAKKQAIKEEEAAKQEQKQKEQEAAAKEEEEKSQKRNFWLIIGGIGLAVLGFLGNQLLQHLRSVRSMKDISNMQNSIANSAKNAATQQLRSQTNGMVNPNIVRGAQQVHSIGKSAAKTSSNGGSSATHSSQISHNGNRSTKKSHTPVTKENMEAYARQQYEKQKHIKPKNTKI